MKTKPQNTRHRAAVEAENRRLKAAVAAIHDLLHRNDVNGAHEACERAMGGGQVSQPSLTMENSAKAQDFATGFNALCERLGVLACGMLALPVEGAEDGRASLQLCGSVEVARIVEARMNGKPSTYMGDHQEVKNASE